MIMTSLHAYRFRFKLPISNFEQTVRCPNVNLAALQRSPPQTSKLHVCRRVSRFSLTFTRECTIPRCSLRSRCVNLLTTGPFCLIYDCTIALSEHSSFSGLYIIFSATNPLFSCKLKKTVERFFENYDTANY